MSALAEARPTLRKSLPAAVAVLAATFAAYLPALHGGLLWDDRNHVTASALRSWHGLGLIWFKLGATAQYYPLLHTLFWIEYRLWGDSMTGYHAANLLLHGAAACLLGCVLQRLLRDAATAWFAAFLFALHPVNVESVAWVTEQKNTLSAVFFLAAALVYLRFDERRNEQRGQASDFAANRKIRGLTPYLLATFLFACALLSKTTTAPLPGALLVALGWRKGRLGWKRDVAPLLPWFAMGAAAGLFSAYVERTYIGASGADFRLSMTERSLVAGRVIAFFLGKFVFPARLTFIYPRWAPDASNLRQFLPPLGVLALSAGLWARRRVQPGALAAYAVFVGLLFPVLGFFNVYPFVYSFVADHFAYLAGMPFFAMVAAAWGRWRARGGIWPRLAAAAAVCVLGGASWRQAADYRDAETLYRATLARNPGSWMAQNNLGFLLRDAGRPLEAIPHYREALRLRPDAIVHFNLAVALFDVGRRTEAIAEYREALRLKPRYPDAHYDLGLALAAVGNLPEAMAEWEETLRQAPDYAQAHVKLADALAGAGRPSEAVSQYEAALRLQPDYAEVRSNLALALAASGRIPEALDQYAEALRLKPGFAVAYNNRGNLYLTQGRIGDAKADFERALRLDPGYASAHYNLGLALRAEGRDAEAEAQFAEAARLERR